MIFFVLTNKLGSGYQCRWLQFNKNTTIVATLTDPRLVIHQIGVSSKVIELLQEPINTFTPEMQGGFLAVRVWHVSQNIDVGHTRSGKGVTQIKVLFRLICV